VGTRTAVGVLEDHCMRHRISAIVLLLAAIGTVAAQGTRYDLVIAGGRVIDPASGLDEIRCIGISGGRIGEISTSALSGRRTIDASGLVVAPGFIDVHAHGQTADTYRFQSLDGVTTTLELELGTADVDGWYKERERGQRINYGVSVGHIKVRMAVSDRQG